MSPLPEDGDGPHRVDHAPDAAEVDRPLEALAASAAVDHDRRHAGLLQSACASSGAVWFSSSQPRRILQVMGMRTASIIPRTSAAVRVQLHHHGRPAGPRRRPS